MKKLLQKDPTKRLGHNSAKEVMEHPWFQRLNWDSLLTHKIRAPFIPRLNSDIDITNFDV